MSEAHIIGVDEVGRGCIAGDLLVCAYCFDPAAPRDLRDRARAAASDSKSFSSRRRREAFIPILEEAGLFAFARRTPEDIDRENIRQATLSAMREAANALVEILGEDVRVIVDGSDLPPGIAAPAESRIKGDASVPEISAASMLAKVRRDDEMEKLALTFPGYGFESHAGYGTRAHRDAIASRGLCPLHRKWAKKFLVT